VKGIESLLETMGPALTDQASLSVPSLPLWAGSVPESEGERLVDQPMVSLHLATHSNGCGVVVCPGGGYRSLASDHEGLQVAKWLNSQGIHAFVLRYRLGPKYHSKISLVDALRCIRLLRYYAGQLHLDPNRLGILGFSAGGHLALAAATHATKPTATADVIDAVDGQPDFVVPVYAVTNGAVRGRKADEYFATDTAVTATTPPTFIVHNHQDSVVPATQSTLIYDALLKAGVPAELHIFSQGNHGLGLAFDDPDVGIWPELLIRWLRRHCFFTDLTRLALSGVVFKDGKSVALAGVSFVPEDDRFPSAHTRVSAATDGRFDIPSSSGPVAADYRVQVHLLSHESPPKTTGIFTLEEAEIYQGYMNFEPATNKKIRLDIEDGRLLIRLV
jgi:acetyl esterase/lipase